MITCNYPTYAYDRSIVIPVWLWLSQILGWYLRRTLIQYIFVLVRFIRHAPKSRHSGTCPAISHPFLDGLVLPSTTVWSCVTPPASSSFTKLWREICMCFHASLNFKRERETAFSKTGPLSKFKKGKKEKKITKTVQYIQKAGGAAVSSSHYRGDHKTFLMKEFCNIMFTPKIAWTSTCTTVVNSNLSDKWTPLHFFSESIFFFPCLWGIEACFSVLYLCGRGGFFGRNIYFPTSSPLYCDCAYV